MGGDHGPVVTVPASFKLLAKYPNVELILVGKEEILQPAIIATKATEQIKNRLTIHHASEEVLMDELPSKALRYKKDSSMRVAINLVKEGKAHACVSAGNTGALVATARFILKTLPGIDRPAIVTRFPTLARGKGTIMLDLGATVDASPEFFCQLAIMGTVLSSIIDNKPRPKVALLNIGSEEIKGNEQIKQAAQLFAKNANINYVGFVEGDELFKGNVDVVVCDGFTGNVVLKTVEGALRLVMAYGKRNVSRNLYTKIAALLALPMLRAVYRDIDPGKYNGATLIGLQGVVIKSHGGANARVFTHALEYAVVEAERNIPQAIRDEISRIFEDQIN
jgi:phosphate acyltransferase